MSLPDSSTDSAGRPCPCWGCRVAPRLALPCCATLSPTVSAPQVPAGSRGSRAPCKPGSRRQWLGAPPQVQASPGIGRGLRGGQEVSERRPQEGSQDRQASRQAVSPLRLQPALVVSDRRRFQSLSRQSLFTQLPFLLEVAEFLSSA